MKGTEQANNILERTAKNSWENNENTARNGHLSIISNNDDQIVETAGWDRRWIL